MYDDDNVYFFRVNLTVHIASIAEHRHGETTYLDTHFDPIPALDPLEICGCAPIQRDHTERREKSDIKTRNYKGTVCKCTMGTILSLFGASVPKEMRFTRCQNII